MDAASVDLKKTVNLPHTDFSMKANLPQMEPKMLERWSAEKLYEKIRAQSAGRPTYLLHDGPPYANGEIHLGTAFNKILKDFIVKTKTMEGFDSPYVPGWDCHGLPIEAKVDSQLGSKKAHMSQAEIRAECRKYAAKYVDLQRRDFVRLGVFGRWQDPYLTMSNSYESVIAGAFVEFLDRGYVYKGLKTVNWCIRDRTALAEAEIEYEDHTSPSIWVRFALTSDAAEIDPALAGRNVYGLIWTTTPWTIPANVAIAYHPKFEYVAAEVAGDVYIVALELLKVTEEKLGWKDPKVIAGFAGAKLEGAIFRHPFLERDSLGILADHVTLEQGTGAVHTAPGHGQEDFEVGVKYGLPVYCPVDAGGKFFHAEGAAGRLPEEIIGKTVWQANPIVIEILKSHGALLGEETVKHSYPHCWRCHNATIFRATDQWFIGMDRNDLRGRTLKAIQGVKWLPDWGAERMSNMIASRPDWCISRQRVWGVPIVVFYCETCQQPFTNRKVLDHVVALFKEHGSDVWYERSASELMGQRRVLALRRKSIPQGERHSGRLVRFRIQPFGGFERRQRSPLALRHVSRRRGSISRLVPQLIADRCRPKRRSAISGMRHQRLDAGRTGPRHVEIARHRHPSGSGDSEIRCRRAAPMGVFGGLHRRRAACPTPSSRASPTRIESSGIRSNGRWAI